MSNITNVSKADILIAYKVLQNIEKNGSTHNAIQQVQNILANYVMELELKNNSNL